MLVPLSVRAALLSALDEAPQQLLAMCIAPPTDSELRAARTAEFRAAYGRLAEAEEAEYLAAKAGAPGELA